jgi:hypothetical protein
MVDGRNEMALSRAVRRNKELIEICGQKYRLYVDYDRSKFRFLSLHS